MRTARNYNACVCRAYIELLPVILVGLVSCHRMKITRHSPSFSASSRPAAARKRACAASAAAAASARAACAPPRRGAQQLRRAARCPRAARACRDPSQPACSTGGGGQCTEGALMTAQQHGCSSVHRLPAALPLLCAVQCRWRGGQTGCVQPAPGGPALKTAAGRCRSVRTQWRPAAGATHVSKYMQAAARARLPPTLGVGHRGAVALGSGRELAAQRVRVAARARRLGAQPGQPSAHALEHRGRVRSGRGRACRGLPAQRCN